MVASTPVITTILTGLTRVQSTAAGPQHPTNSYLWDGPKGLVIIDPCVDVTPAVATPAALLVTHVQQEHIEGAANFPEASLHIPAGDEYLCDGAAAYEASIEKWEEPWDWDSRGNFQGHLAGARNERPTEEPQRITGTFEDGDEIFGLRVLGTPGHGKHAVTFLAEIEGRRVAFCGDLVCGDGQLWNWFDCNWDYGLEGGPRALAASAERLIAEKPEILLPAHGEPILDAVAALQRLIERLRAVAPTGSGTGGPLNFPDNENPIPGWRQLSPSLYQWKDGNCALVVSKDNVGLLVDDGLCHWLSLPQRAPHHHGVMVDIKAALGLSRIEAVIVTHYHGDHIYNIPDLVADDGAEIVALDVVAKVMENERAYNLAAPLWWYGDTHERVPVDRHIADGEIFRWREYEIRFFHLAGQTYYHAGMTTDIDGARVCFVGDAIFGWNPGVEPVICYNDNSPESRGWAYSAERLIEEDANLLVCGHGSAIREPMPMLLQKRENWKAQLECFQTLSARAELRLFFDPYWPSARD